MVVMIVMSNVVMMMLMAIDGDSHNVTHEHSDGDFDGHHGDDVDGWSVTYFAKDDDDNGEGNDDRELKQSRLRRLRTR